jgi:hypothetical protein
MSRQRSEPTFAQRGSSLGLTRAVLMVSSSLGAADIARRIVEETPRRGQATSQRLITAPSSSIAHETTL